MPCARALRALLVVAVVAAAGACKGMVPAGPNGALRDPAELADRIEDRLRDHCVGYAFTVCYREDLKSIRAWGEARRPQDPPARPMSGTDKLNVASVSKTISAVALIHALWKSPSASLDSPFAPYLPSHWTVHPSLGSVTFRQLLQHKSGFRFGDHDYAGLKTQMAAGIDEKLIGTESYQNGNYSILRLLVPAVAGANVVAVPPGDSAIVAALEQLQAQQYADAYIAYVQAHVFDPTGGMPDMACKPTDADAALCYQFPKTAASGGNFGDMTLTCASRGWHVSALQLGLFFRELHYSEDILPGFLTDLMKSDKLGYFGVGTTASGVGYYQKGGYYPGSKNPGELLSLLIGFGDDIQVAVLVNSQYSEGKIDDAVRAAFDEWYP
jgi:CubicO group peptidase (beta-lactamase class C family)